MSAINCFFLWRGEQTKAVIQPRFVSSRTPIYGRDKAHAVVETQFGETTAVCGCKSCTLLCGKLKFGALEGTPWSRTALFLPAVCMESPVCVCLCVWYARLYHGTHVHTSV